MLPIPIPLERPLLVVGNDDDLLAAALAEAVADNAIAVAYQPVIDARRRRITSVEALARWYHPTLGAVPPSTFIPLAEELGLIEVLGEQVLDQACRDAGRLPADIRVAVNLSPHQLRSDRLHDRIVATAVRHCFDLHRLQIEVTEGVFLEDADRAIGQLKRLSALGVQTLMDDFGMGYSSFAYFKRLRFDKVKIDRAFVQDVRTSPESQAIVKALLGLCHDLNIAVVAEGVETQSQLRYFLERGCTLFQGFLFGRPSPIEQIAALAWNSRADGGQALLNF